MRIFVSEYVCSGVWPEPDLPPSLAREGRAMLLALVSDLAALPGVTVCTTWDARLGKFPPLTPALRPSPRPSPPNCAVRASAAARRGEGGHDAAPVSSAKCECAIIGNPSDESVAFRRFAAECDATYIIAPELNDLLTERCRAVIDAGGRSLNASPDAIAACSDKWETFRRLSKAGLPTVPTARLDPAGGALPFPFPVVIKPRFGAGSQDTFLVRNEDQLRSAAARFPSDVPTTEGIIQPCIAGRSLSVAAIFRTDGTLREVWPVGEQRLSDDGLFTYLGGTVPLSLAAQPSARISDFGFRISDLIFQISGAMPGLRGYIGFDIIVRENADSVPLIVDINPRLTTGYLGYRALSHSNLSKRLLWPDDPCDALQWHDGTVEFQADGHARLSAH